jgi:hypothetical protein
MMGMVIVVVITRGPSAALGEYLGFNALHWGVRAPRIMLMLRLTSPRKMPWTWSNPKAKVRRF